MISGIDQNFVTTQDRSSIEQGRTQTYNGDQSFPERVVEPFQRPHFKQTYNDERMTIGTSILQLQMFVTPDNTA